MEQVIVISDQQHRQRLDHALMAFFPDESRSIIQMWIKNGFVIYGECADLKPSHVVRVGDQYRVRAMDPVPAQPKAVPIAFDILYEDEHILVLNKPAGLVVHPAAGHYDDTLVNGLLHHCNDLSGIGGVLRPGIVHRLDKDTSGVMVVAKHDRAHQNLAQQFQEKSNIKGFLRQYIGFTWGVPTPPSGEIITHIGRDPHHRQRMKVVSAGAGKYAHTLYTLLHIFGEYLPLDQRISKVKFTLLTGRTHQIRVHCLHHKMPMLGDQVYGNSATKARKLSWDQEIIAFPRQALHAHKLDFHHPISQQTLSFTADLPNDLTQLEGLLKDGHE